MPKMPEKQVYKKIFTNLAFKLKCSIVNMEVTLA